MGQAETIRSVIDWQHRHQPWELHWWRTEGIARVSDDEYFFNRWRGIAAFIAPVGSIIDIGCGARPPFAGTVIDPLLREYQKLTPPEWWDAVRAICDQAEHKFADLSADTIICWNALRKAKAEQGQPGAHAINEADRPLPR